jgi:hypothetical protein
MSTENQLWGAPRIHGELLKIGFEVAQSSVAKYMVSDVGRQARDGEPSCITTRLTVIPTINFRMLYGFVIVRWCRRHARLRAMGIRDKPTAPASP